MPSLLLQQKDLPDETEAAACFVFALGGGTNGLDHMNSIRDNVDDLGNKAILYAGDVIQRNEIGDGYSNAVKDAIDAAKSYFIENCDDDAGFSNGEYTRLKELVLSIYVEYVDGFALAAGADDTVGYLCGNFSKKPDEVKATDQFEWLPAHAWLVYNGVSCDTFPDIAVCLKAPDPDNTGLRPPSERDRLNEGRFGKVAVSAIPDHLRDYLTGGGWSAGSNTDFRY